MTLERSLPSDISKLEFREVESLPPLQSIVDGDLYSLRLSNNTTPFTHGLHRFPAKFIPQIPRWALDQLAPANGVVLDPFMGSGTTLVEAKTRPGVGIGFDIDPLARFIARAKTDLPSSERISALSNEIASTWSAPEVPIAPPMADVRNFEHWFSAEAWGWLHSLRNSIVQLDCTDQERGFLLTVFSSILRWVSNADDQSQKTYVSGTLPKDPPDVRSTFWRALSRAMGGLQQLEQSADRSAVTHIPDDGDACAMPLEALSVDLIVTSPPYLDSVDYMYNLMLEYFWLGPLLGVPTRSAFNRMRRETIGAKSPSTSVALPEALQSLQLDHLDASRRVAASTFFGMMQRHFAEASRCLKTGGRYVLVVGNSQSQRDVIPVHTALIHMAAEEGFRVEKVFGYRIRRHYMKFPRAGRGGIILIDWVIVLRKTDGEATNHLPQLPLPWVTLDPSAVAH